MTISQKLRTLRSNLGISQKNLARIIGVAQSTIDCYEMDIVPIPEEFLTSVAEYFRVNINYFYNN
ncbi:MAG: helix-turn-helix domain-containing protein [Clostridiales bacterium]|jgi:transcriptional regulator with XRE-family HTH domain|nr:helix-turn-helix domain-containing protein [Clostridiales bacterium]